MGDASNPDKQDTPEKVRIARKPNGQFQKGQTGNPRGRPYKVSQEINSASNYRNAFLRYALKKANVNARDGKSEISLIEAAIYQALLMAAKGDRQMIKYVLKEFFVFAKDFDQEFLDNVDRYYDANDALANRQKKIRSGKLKLDDKNAEDMLVIKNIIDSLTWQIERTRDGFK